MDGFSGAASIITVLDVIVSLCFEYSVAVKDAKKDIERLRRKVADLRNVLEEMDKLLNDGRGKSRLWAAQDLACSLTDCIVRLEELRILLDPGRARKAMSRLGMRALKWPFTSKEIEKMIGDLERYEQTFTLALQVDETGLILDIDQKIESVDKKTDDLHQKTDSLHLKIDSAKLPVARGACFDSHMEEHNARCLENTRLELQRHVAEWAKDKNGKSIFWLNGMAGTGKSTIARTVAQSFAENNQLGASFFFKKGGGDCNNAARFFTTIATDLMVRIPALIPGIRKAIDADPSISERALKIQFEKLILSLLLEIKPVSPQALGLVVVVDALDECDQEEDIREILRLLSRTRDIVPISLRFFLTSRPELHIRLGFTQMADGTYQDLILHEIPQQTIERDIARFLEHELGEIRKLRRLSPHWPSNGQIQALVDMAVPLFIFAATACRYIGDKRSNPRKRLDILLQYNTASKVSTLDRIYLPILNQLFDDKDEGGKEERTSEFREIIGSIVVLQSPLSIASLAILLDTPKDDISCMLDLLHSILKIPDDENMPVRPLHLSFREFLLDPEKHGKSPFWVDERETHQRLTSKCLLVMSSSKGLRQNLCNLLRPGTPRSEIDKPTIDRCLQPEVRYACCYWVHHLEQSKEHICDDGLVYLFLQKYFLYWLEAMSLINKASDSINMISRLRLLTDPDRNVKTWSFLQDAKCFALRNRAILEYAPLQLYSSALIFSPAMSIIRKTFNDHIPQWTTRLSKAESNCDQNLKGHSSGISAVSFSPNGHLVASGSDDSTVRLWDVITGFCRSTLQGHFSGVSAVAFSPNGRLLASGSFDSTVRLWDVTAESYQNTFEGHSSGVRAIAFSPDSQLIASASDDSTIRLWDTVTSTCRNTLEGHSDWVRAIAFSPDGHSVASGSRDATLRLWDVATGSCSSILKGHSSGIYAVAFSANGLLLASASGDSKVRLWDVAMGSCRKILAGHSSVVRAVAFSPDGKVLASGSGDATARLWDPVTGSCRSTLLGHSNWVRAVAFSPDGKVLASGSGDSTVWLWDASTGSCRSTLKGHSRAVRALAFSPDGQVVASGRDDSKVQLWDARTKSCRGTLEGHSCGVTALAFSPNGRLAASGSGDATIRLWDVATWSCRSTLDGHSDRVNVVAFSPDSQLLASGSNDSTIRLWDVATGSSRIMLAGHSNFVSALAFSPGGQLVASGSGDSTVRLWDAATGFCRNTLEGHSSGVYAVAFSQNGQLVASGSSDSTVRLWDAGTGSCSTKFERHSRRVRALSFSSDGSNLTTDRGQIALSSPTFDTFSDEKNLQPAIFLKDQWVNSAKQRLLWLPIDYRPTCTAVWGNTIWLGNMSGDIITLEFEL
ncbi:hypothetical protein MMC07_003055 [Pseudocyphellaria aurata]|nr:hypothetical protein [Pseudocyphellaria aurata]